MKKTLARKRLIAFSILVLSVPMLDGCRDKRNALMLGIEGYNYTDRYIAQFSVDGAGGGHVSLSTWVSGGGGTYCCIVYDPDRPLPETMPVEWTFGHERGENGKIVMQPEHHRAIGTLGRHVPERPRFLEVHFMPDGKVRLLITAERSSPLVLVDRSRPRSL